MMYACCWGKASLRVRLTTLSAICLFAALPMVTLAQNSSATYISLGGFENPTVSSFVYAPTGSDWNWSGPAGIRRNGSFGVDAPEGVQTAFLNSNSYPGSFSRDVTLAVGTYKVSFKAAGKSASEPAPIQVTLDGTAIGPMITPSGAFFASFSTIAFQVNTAGTYRLGFRAANAPESGYSLVDDVSVQKVTPNVVESGFETPVYTNSPFYGYQPSGSRWTWKGFAGIQHNGSLGANAPEGVQTAFLQGDSNNPGSFSQGTTLEAGVYKITFQGAQRPTGSTLPIKVTFDGFTLGDPITPSSTSFATYSTAAFTVTAGAHNVGFSAGSGGGDAMSLIDAVSVTLLASTPDEKGFENPPQTSAPNYSYAPTGSKWNWSGSAGIRRNGSLGSDAHDAPEGIQTAFINGGSTPGGFSQNITLTSGYYKIAFQAASQDNTLVAPIQVSINGTAIGDPITPTGSAFSLYTTVPFQAQAADGIYRLEFRAVHPNGSARSFIDDVSVRAATSGGVEGSFETPVYTTSPFYGYYPSGSEWIWKGFAGIQHNGSLGANAPEGVQTAFLQGDSNNPGSFSQRINLAAGSHVVTFQAARRSVGGLIPIQVMLDGTAIGATITPSSTAFASYSTPSFQASAGSHILELRTASGGGDSMSLVDSVSVSGTALVVSPPPLTPTTVSVPASLAPVSPLTATPGSGAVTLNWQASSGATSYKVFRRTSGDYNFAAPLDTVGATTTYTNGGLSNGTTYYYVVQAYGSGGKVSAYSNEASATPVALPSAPTNLVATAGNTQIVLNWNAVNGATSYKVKRSTMDGGPYTTLAPSVSGNSYTDTGLSNGTSYYYRVYAVNAAGNSGDSNQAQATPFAPAPTPTPTIAPTATPVPAPTATPTPGPNPTPTPTSGPPAPVRGVDLSIQAMTTPAQNEIGVGFYYPDEQEADFSIPNRGAATFQLVVKNEGTENDSFRLNGRGDTPGWKVSYFDAFTGGTDISTMVKGNNYLIGIAKGQSKFLRVEVTPDSTVPQNQSKLVPVAVYSENASLVKDQVTANAITGSVAPPIYRPDSSVRVASQTTYKGEGIYDFIASNEQTIESNASASSNAVYNLKITNRGSVADSFNVKLPVTKQGWSLFLYDALSEGTDVTNIAQQGVGFATGNLAPQQSKEFRLEVKPNSGTIGSFSFSVVTRSVTDDTVQDVGAFNTTVATVSANSVVTFIGEPRACAGGIDNSLHKLALTLHATNNGVDLPQTPIALSFENNVGHNYGTREAPDIRHKAKIYDLSEPIVANRWKETVTIVTDNKGDAQVIVLSSDVISQPRLIARWQNEIVGSLLCNFATATSRRGAPDPVVGTYTGWENDDTGWTCNFSALEQLGDAVQGSVSLKFLDNSGAIRPLSGHKVRISFRSISAFDGTQVYDPDEATSYVSFLDADGNNQNSFETTTNSDGIAVFTLKANAGITDVTSIAFRATNLTQWAK